MELFLTAVSPYGAANLNHLALLMCDEPFTHVLNLRNGETVLSLQDPSVPRTPLSLVMDADSFQRLGRCIAPGFPFQTGGNTLSCAGITITAQGAERFSCQMTAKYDPGDGDPYPRLCGAAAMFANPGSLIRTAAPNLSIWADKEMTPTQRKAAGLLERGAPAELVGLGEGLTPAGDDFLIGVLAALEWMGMCHLRRRLVPALTQRLQQTTTLSAAFLLRAVSGEYASPILALFQGLGDSVRTAQATAELCSIGHSSGSDMLGGVLWAIHRYMK